MRINKVCTLLVLLLLASGAAYSQENRTEIRVDFRANSAVLDSTHNNNAERLSEITSFFQSIKQDSTLTLVNVQLSGSASLEGSYQLNKKLAQERLATLEDIIRNETEIPDSIIAREDSYISWEFLKKNIIGSDLNQKQAALDIIALEPILVDYPGGRHIDHRVVKLQNLDGGKVWRHLHSLYAKSMRNACVVLVTRKKETPMPQCPGIVEPDAITLQTKSSLEVPTILPREIPWTPNLYVKTNFLGWGLAISNAAVEVDLAKHWSAALPIYYSALNYFTSDIKFRTLAVQPELRYWFDENNQNFFVGAHLGYAQYNIALNGDYRYQDHKGTSPALGGGISVGYRMPILKSNKWHIEFLLGAGVYDLHYDKFYNVNNGKYIGTYHKTYWGIDNAAINISYRFGLNKPKK